MCIRDSVNGYYGVALADTGDIPGAEVAFRKELASNPNDYSANFQLGKLLKLSLIHISCSTFSGYRKFPIIATSLVKSSGKWGRPPMLSSRGTAWDPRRTHGARGG